MSKDSVTLVISDTHFPFHREDVFKTLAELKKEFRPTMVIQSGDLVDQHTLGRWTPEADAEGSLEELEEARSAIDKLAAIFPHLNICLGNHDTRVLKRFKELRIPSAFLRSLHEVYGAPSTWRWSDSFVISGVRYFHGDGFSGKQAALNAAERYRQSCVIGHVHSYAGIQYAASPNDRIFGMNVGCLIDPAKYAFAYAKEMPHRPVISVGLIINGVPRLVPL